MTGDDFRSLFGAEPTVRAEAPGRVNLIGEHTDYNDGFVLPMPIPQHTRVELAPRNDQLVRGYSPDIPGSKTQTYLLGEERLSGAWIDYVQGLTAALAKDGHRLRGFDLRVESEVPVGSGLSSSAALEVGVLRALRSAFDLPIDDRRIAQLGRRAENEFVGAPVGIMDQMAVSVGRQNAALFLDTRTLESRLIALPADAELVVIASAVQHAHGTGGYRIRRAECEEAARSLGVDALRDVSVGELDRVEKLGEPHARRARHVITENQRVLDMLPALERGDLRRAGELFVESHASMRDDFQISVPEIDLLVELSRAQPEVYGARLTGGGFGGSIVVLAHRGAGARTARAVTQSYDTKTGLRARVLLPTGL